ICPGTSVMISASGANTYQWSPANTLSDSVASSPVATPASTTTYVVTGIGPNGCAGKDSVKVQVFTSTLNAGNDTSMCAGDTLQLQATGGNSYSWSPTTFLINPASATPLAFPSSTTAYTVQSSNGLCNFFDTVVLTVHPLPLINAGNDTS